MVIHVVLDKLCCSLGKWSSCYWLHGDGKRWSLGEWTKHWAILAYICLSKWRLC